MKKSNRNVTILQSEEGVDDDMLGIKEEAAIISL